MTNTLKKSFLILAACVVASSLFADTAVFEGSDLNVSGGPKSIGSITLSVPSSNGMTWQSNSLYAGGSGKIFHLDATGGATISQVLITMNTSSNRYTASNITNCTSCTKSGSVYTCDFSTPQTSIDFKNNGGGVGITKLEVTYSSGGGGQTTPTVNSVTVAPATITLDPNATQQLTATVDATPATADKTVTWESSNTSVATVSTTGLVTAVAQGTATITAKSNLDNTKSGSCAVTVNAPATPIPVTSIALNKTSAIVSISGTETLTVSYTPSDANTGLGITWSSNDPTVATVNNGVVTGVKAGTATITATSEGGKTATCAVTVQAVAVTGVTLAPTTASVRVNNTTSLTATVQPANATDKSLTWSSSNPAVATVNNGTVTGVAAGTATITVTTVDGGETATCAVTVTDAAPIPPTNLTCHVPGVYEDKLANGGYATNLTVVGGREYELYYASRDPEGDYPTLPTRAGDKQTGIENTNSEGYCKAADGWVEANITSISGGTSQKAGANGEFAEVYDEWRMQGQSLKLHIKGYDQFSYYGYDKSVEIDSKTGNYKKEARFQVFIDGEMQPETQCGTTASVRRYDISAGEHLIEVKALSAGDSRLHAFSLRLAQAPFTKYLKGNDSAQVIMQNAAIRPITYYTKYNSFGETRLVWDGPEATGISLQTRGSDAVGDTLIVTGIASCPVGVYKYLINTYYNNALTGSIPGKFEVQSDIKALTETSAEGYTGMNINPINFSYHALSASDVTLSWENNIAPGGITGNGADGLYSISGAPQTAGTFIYTVTVLGGNSISDTLFIEDLVLGDNPILYLYKNARSYLKDGVYQYLSSSDGGYDLVPFTAIDGKRGDAEYNRFKAIIISEDADADNPEVVELIRDGAGLPILNLNAFAYAKDANRLGWGDPNNGAIDSSKTKQQGCKITIERAGHPIYSKLLNISEGKEVKILDSYAQNGVMPIYIDNMPVPAACLATAPTRGVNYYDAGPLQTAIHEIPSDQRLGKYICLPLASQVSFTSDGKKLLKGIMEYLLSSTQAPLPTPDLRITKFVVSGIEATINESEKTIKLELTKAQYDDMDLKAVKPQITLADPIYSHVTPASNEEVNLEYTSILSKSYIVSDYVNRVVYDFMIQLINPQGIEETYEAGQWVNIYDIYGRKVVTSNEDIYTMDLPHGVYVVVTENGNTLKIMR